MLETKIMNRGTGKTLIATTLLENDKENKYLLVTPHEFMKKLYPKEIQNRVVTIQDILDGSIRGRKFEKLVIDEGFLMSKEKLAQFYYMLGRNNYSAYVLGTI